MQSVEETNAALAEGLADDALKEQDSLPKSGESKAPEEPPPKAVSVEDQVGSSASTELELGSDGRPLHEPEGSIFPTNSHESDKTAKKLLTGLQREMTSRFQDRPLLLFEDLKGLEMAGDLSDDGQHLTSHNDVRRRSPSGNDNADGGSHSERKSSEKKPKGENCANQDST